MTLTVRLDPTLEVALERYCASTGTSKSLVVQESLAAFLLAEPAAARTRGTAAPSANFQAFEAAGLIGTGALPEFTKGANKAAVRARVAARFAERKAGP